MSTKSSVQNVAGDERGVQTAESLLLESESVREHPQGPDPEDEEEVGGQNPKAGLSQSTDTVMERPARARTKVLSVRDTTRKGPT